MSIDVEAAGAAVTAALVAGELESRTAGSPHPSAAQVCANCGVELQGAYCHACGQHAHVHRSLWHMLEEGLHGLLHFDTKSWRTLPLLIARPGLLTRRYIQGQRVRYVSPLALFLFSVFLMFLVVSQLSEPLANFSVSSARPGDFSRAGLAVDSTAPDAPATGGPETAAQGADANAAPAKPKPKLKVNFVLPHWPEGIANEKVQQALRNPDLTLYRIKDISYKFSFMLIPISLPFLWLMFCRRRDVAVYDHVVFSMYSLSFMSLWAILFVLLAEWSVTARWVPWAFLIPPFHMYLHLRESYSLSGFAAVWRTCLLLVVAGTVFLAFLLTVVGLSVV
jgi:hypothetical protein